MKKILLITILTGINFFSSTVYAVCTEIHAPKGLACIPDRVLTIAGSNADTKLLEIQANMETTSLLLQDAVTRGFADMMSTQQKSANEIISANVKASQMIISQETQILKANIQNELAMKTEYEARKIKRSRSVLSDDDTAEEMKVITDALETASDEDNVLIIIEALTIGWDKRQDRKIPIAINRGKGVCSEEIIAEGACSIPKSITPGKKLKAFFQACNQVKQQFELKERMIVAQDTAIQESAMRINKAMSQTSSTTATSQRLKEQRTRNCSVEDMKNNLCLTELSIEDKQELIRTCVINGNADVNASSLYMPKKVCGLEYSVPSKETYEILKKNALDQTSLENNPLQDQNALPVVYSYNNINQLRSSSDFTNNILAMDLVSNQQAKDINKASSTEFQSRYLSRMAKLSLAESSFSNSTKMRTGKKLGLLKADDPKFEKVDELAPTKEDALGGGELDFLNAEIDKANRKLKLSKNEDGSIKAEALNGQSNASYWDNLILEQLTLQSKLLFRQILQKEKEELLKAAQLASEVNSPVNIQYIKNLRSGN